MVVEEYSHSDALDMTWVRFLACLKYVPSILRIKRGDPMSHQEHIEMQKEAKESCE